LLEASPLEALLFEARLLCPLKQASSRPVHLEVCLFEARLLEASLLDASLLETNLL
jgi:hypothetical protein